MTDRAETIELVRRLWAEADNDAAAVPSIARALRIPRRNASVLMRLVILEPWRVAAIMPA